MKDNSNEIKGVFHLREQSYQPILYSAFTLEEIKKKFQFSLTSLNPDFLWSVDGEEDLYVEFVELSRAYDLKLRKFFYV